MAVRRSTTTETRKVGSEAAVAMLFYTSCGKIDESILAFPLNFLLELKNVWMESRQPVILV